MFILKLNHMRDRCEVIQTIAQADTREELEALIESERVESYTTPQESPYGGGEWHHTFREGGPLMWHNPPPDDGSVSYFGEGIIEVQSREEYLEQCAAEYDQMAAAIPRVVNGEVIRG